MLTVLQPREVQPYTNLPAPYRQMIENHHRHYSPTTKLALPTQGHLQHASRNGPTDTSQIQICRPQLILSNIASPESLRISWIDSREAANGKAIYTRPIPSIRSLSIRFLPLLGTLSLLLFDIRHFGHPSQVSLMTSNITRHDPYHNLYVFMGEEVLFLDLISLLSYVR
jgi:hypothetical protein